MPRTAPEQRHAQGQPGETLSVSALKQRQLLFLLTRQLAEAQFVRGGQARANRLWQEAADLELDPDRLVALLYGVADHDELREMERVDRQFLQSGNSHRWNGWAPVINRLLGGGFTRKGSGAWHRNAPRAGSPMRS